MGKVLPEGQRAVGVGSVQPSVLLLGIMMLRWSRWFLAHCLQAIKHHVRNRLQNCLWSWLWKPVLGIMETGAFCDIQVPWCPPSLDPWRDGLTETATTYKEDCCCFFTHKVMSDSCGPMDCSPPGSSVHGIFRARILEWVAISFSRGISQPRDQIWVSFGRQSLHHCVTWEAPIEKIVAVVQSLNRVRLFATPWTAAHQASLSFTISQSLLKLMPIVSMMPYNHLILCCPLLLQPSIFPSIRVFSSESALHIRWSKYWSFSFSTSPSNQYSVLISFRID